MSMRIINDRIKPLLIAGFITAFMIISIANLSCGVRLKSVLDYDSRTSPCAISVCSLL